MNNFGRVMIHDEKQEEIITKDIISVPWENDNFSLNLDTTFTPPKILKRATKQFVPPPPQTSSPLRNQWRVSQENPHLSKLIEDDEDIVPHQEDAEHQSTKKKLLSKKPKPEMTISTTDIFPYSNSSNLFVSREKSPAPSISSRNRVEHVSPLLNSPVLQFDDILPFSKHDSQISENWKYTTPSIASSHNDTYRTGSPSIASSYRYRTVSPSIASEYRSIAVPKNADNLILFSSDYDNPSERPYSHYFNPAFTKPKKRSTSLLRKIMNNIKHRFVAAK